MSKTERRWGSRAGIVVDLARALVFTLIGIFITKAAIEYDPDEAIGLDGCAAEAGGGELRPGAARHHRCRADRVRRLLPCRRSLPRRRGRQRFRIDALCGGAMINERCSSGRRTYSGGPGSTPFQ